MILQSLFLQTICPLVNFDVYPGARDVTADISTQGYEMEDSSSTALCLVDSYRVLAWNKLFVSPENSHRLIQQYY